MRLRPHWEDLATRARGLAARLLDQTAIDSLASAEGLEVLAGRLRSSGYALPEGILTADDLELAVRRRAAAYLRVLARWGGPRNELLAVIFEDEDRRSLRAIVRGAIQGAPAELRLAGLIPTPGLPERVLRELANQPSPGALVALLIAWQNPYGPPLLRAARATQPDLLAIERNLDAAFAARALRGAWATGSRVVLDYVREGIDLENALAALVLAGGESEMPAKEAFIEGGRYLPLTAFLEVIAAGEGAAAARRLAVAFRSTPLVAAAFTRATEATDVEERLLRSRLAALRAAARRDPAGPASVLELALRLRAEAFSLQRVIWGLALAAPRDALTLHL